jgi:hypothetical protein
MEGEREKGRRVREIRKNNSRREYDQRTFFLCMVM